MSWNTFWSLNLSLKTWWYCNGKGKIQVIKLSKILAAKNLFSATVHKTIYNRRESNFSNFDWRDSFLHMYSCFFPNNSINQLARLLESKIDRANLHLVSFQECQFFIFCWFRRKRNRTIKFILSDSCLYTITTITKQIWIKNVCRVVNDTITVCDPRVIKIFMTNLSCFSSLSRFLSCWRGLSKATYKPKWRKLYFCWY